MISHKYKCIFIHIPRTAGSSIEKAICGANWWEVEPRTKHLLASQAKAYYAPYWDSYFKFSFIRNPWDRIVSMKKYAEYFYGSSKYPDLITLRQLKWYKKRFGFPIMIENDYRFSDRRKLIRPVHDKQQVYGNILDEELDFIGKFESLNDDFEKIADILSLKERTLEHTNILNRTNSTYQSYYSEVTKELVGNIYQRDIERYEYEY